MFSNKHALLKKTQKFCISFERIEISLKVLNSAYHEEQAIEVSRKSANFSRAGVKKNLYTTETRWPFLQLAK